MQFNLARTYSPKIIAWDWPKLQEIEIGLKNEKRGKIGNTVNKFHSFDLGIPKDNWRIRASIPNPKSQVCYTNLEFVNLSHKKT